jgi:hypothetical protein
MKEGSMRYFVGKIASAFTFPTLFVCKFLDSLQEQQKQLKILAAFKHCKDVA